MAEWLPLIDRPTAVVAGYEARALGVFFKLGAVSATNPKFTGQIVIDQVSIGGTRGDIRQASLTYPIKASTFARVIV